MGANQLILFQNFLLDFRFAFLLHQSLAVAFRWMMTYDLSQWFFFRQKLRLQVSQLKRGSHLRSTSQAKASLILSGNNTQMLWPTPSGVKTSAFPTKVWCCIGLVSNLIPYMLSLHFLSFLFGIINSIHKKGTVPYFEIK